MILIDTNILVWLTSSPEKLTPNAKKYVNQARKSKEIFVSSISIWEIALLIKKKRLSFKIGFDSWLSKVKQLSYLKFMDIDVEIAVKSVQLNWSNQDPADRIIVATAQNLGTKVITSDRKILQLKSIESIW